MLSLNIKNEKQTTFHKKVSGKRRSKNLAFDAFAPPKRLFSMVSNFSGGTFLQFS